MKAVDIPLEIFVSEKEFHDAFAKIMGFPGFYGRNWDAWIDCMSCLDDPDAGMSSVLVSTGEQIEFVVGGCDFPIELDDSKVFQRFCVCTGFVNSRFRENQSQTRIIISN